MATRKLLFIGFLFIAACNIDSPQQKRIENLAKIYLDSINNNSPNYKILRFSNLHATFDTSDDDPNYGKYKNDSLKLDSFKKSYKPKITAWVIYVTYKGKDDYGNLGKHKYQCVINKSLSKCIVGIEVE